MKILFIADAVGKPGRRAIKTLVPPMKKKGADLVIANGENVARGLGITPRLAGELLRAGVDVITTGNHLFRRAEIAELLQKDPRVLRPQNFRTRAPGKGHHVAETEAGVRVGVFNLVGQLYMDPAADPVDTAEQILAGPLAGVDVRILDFHAEATGEKRGLALYLDGRISAFIGTHTHVQTADEHVTENGTAYISDAGLTGSPTSVIGMDPEAVLSTLRTGLPSRFSPARTGIELQGVLLDVDENTGRARSIQRVREPVPDPPEDG